MFNTPKIMRGISGSLTRTISKNIMLMRAKAVTTMTTSNRMTRSGSNGFGTPAITEPISMITKPEVRAVARGLGLATADKPESQEICFVPGGDYRDALRERAGWQPAIGPLLDVGGERVGEHKGTAGYTIGQRQGLGVALGEPRYVSRIDPLTNTITLGRRVDLETTTIQLERTSFVAGDAPGGRTAPFRAEIRIRHRTTPIGASVRPATASEPARGGRWLVETDTPVWAAAPGQAAVLYDGDVVIGGGRIARPAVTEQRDATGPVAVGAGS